MAGEQEDISILIPVPAGIDPDDPALRKEQRHILDEAASRTAAERDWELVGEPAFVGTERGTEAVKDIDPDGKFLFAHWTWTAQPKRVDA